MDPADGSELLSQLQEGEFWVEEEEFLREFDEVTVGFPITEAGHLQSLYSGEAPCGLGLPARPPGSGLLGFCACAEVAPCAPVPGGRRWRETVAPVGCRGRWR